MNRRNFLGAALAAPGLTAAPAHIGGIEAGIQSFCFNDRPFEAMLDAVAATGARSLELWQGHLEPRGVAREQVRQWRKQTPLTFFESARRTIERRGLHLNSYNVTIRGDWDDAEIERAFAITRALGVDIITSSSNIAVAARLEAPAARHRIRVGFHNHAAVKPDEFAIEDDFRRALEGRSEWLGINLDLGHFGAAGFDPLPMIRRWKARIFVLHFKDRKPGENAHLPFGTGDSRLAEVLRYMKAERWQIPANIEHVEKTMDRVAAVKANFDWMVKELNR